MYVCNSQHLYLCSKRLLSIIQNSLGIFRAEVMETGSWCRLFLRMLTEIGRIQFWMRKIYWDLLVINLKTFALWTFRKQFLILCHVRLTNISYLILSLLPMLTFFDAIAKIWEFKLRFLLLYSWSQPLFHTVTRFYGVMVSTQDSESCDPSSNLGGTCVYLFSSDWNTVFCVYDKAHKWENCWKINDHLAVHYFQQI